MYRSAYLIVLTLAVALAIWAELNRRDAYHQLDLVTAPHLAARAELLRQQSPRLTYQAALIALEAYARAPTLETDALLRRSTTLLPRISREFTHDKRLFAIAFTADKRLAFGGAGGSVKVEGRPDPREGLTLEHQYPVHAISISDDGAWIATREYNPRAVYLWNALTGAKHRVLEHTERVTDARFAHAAKSILTYGWDIPATLWSIDTGQPEFQTDADGKIRCADLDQQDKLLVTASSESRVEVWDIAANSSIAEHNHDAVICAISPDGKWFASGGNDGSIIVSAVADTAVQHRYATGSRVTMLTFTSDDRLISSGYDSLHAWSPESGSGFANRFEQLNESVYSLAANRIATISGDLVQVWDAGDGHEIARMMHDARVEAIAFDSTGQLLASTADRQVTIWDLASLNRFRHADMVNDVVYSADGSRVISASGDKTTRVWDIASGGELRRLDHDATVWSVDASRDGDWFASGDSSGMARVWSTQDFEERARLAHVGEIVMFSVVSVAASPDSSLLATGTKNSWAYLWELEYGKSRAPLKHSSSITSLAFSPDGDRLATASGRLAKIWDINELSEIRQFSHDTGVLGVAVDPEGAMLATAGRDGMVRLWDMRGGQLIREMAHDETASAVTFSPDGRYLASASDDRTARVWDVQSGAELNRILLEGAARAVAFAPDGSNLVTGDKSGSVRIWPLQPEALISDSCARLPHRLYEAGIDTYLKGQASMHPCGK